MTVTAYALSALSGISAVLCLLMIMQTPAYGKHRARASPAASVMYTRGMETTTERFTIDIINPGAVAIEDGTLAARPLWRRRVALFRGPAALLAATQELSRIEDVLATDGRATFDRCVSRLGEMRECGRVLVYRNGWRHLDDTVNETHWGFPRREV